MDHKFTNTTVKTTTINGKRYDANRVIREFCNRRNNADNYFVDDDTEIILTDKYVTIGSICGNYTRLLA